MLYTTITINNNEYKLRLNAKASVELENRLGKNPLNVLMELSEHNLPSVETIVTIMHSALQAYQHGFSMDDTYDLYDKMVDEGMSLETILPIIVEIFKVSGYIKTEESKADGKN